MAFELFEKRKHKFCRAEGTFITIHKDKTRISFSYPLTLWIRDNGVTLVDYLFDKEEGKIAFQPSHEGYTVHRRQRSQAYVSGRTFLLHIGNPKPGRYPAIVKDGMIVADCT